MLILVAIVGLLAVGLAARDPDPPLLRSYAT